MLGAIIGDIAGSTFECSPTNDYDFELFATGSGYTDDTICTIAVADAILKGEDYGVCIHEWCRKYPNPIGAYGALFRQWVWSDNPKPYGSYGNGAAMRVSPVAWAYNDRESILREASKAAECTHNHPEGIKGAQTIALAIHYAIKLKSQKGQIDPDEVEQIMRSCAEYAHYNIDIKREEVIDRFDETCQGTVPVALWIIRSSESFEDAIRKAVSLGVDADTMGAIVGSIAEPIWGVPMWMREKATTYLSDEMRKTITQFERKYKH